MLEEADRTITVRDGSRIVTLSMAQAVIRKLTVDAVKGQSRAQQLFIKMLSMIEKESYDEWLKTEHADQKPSEIRIVLVSPEARKPETVRDQDSLGAAEGRQRRRIGQGGRIDYSPGFKPGDSRARRIECDCQFGGWLSSPSGDSEKRSSA